MAARVPSARDARRGLDHVAVAAAPGRRNCADRAACMVPRHMSTGSGYRPATNGTGCSRGAGRSPGARGRIREQGRRPRAPAAATTTGARTMSRRVGVLGGLTGPRVGPERVGLDADGPAALEEHLVARVRGTIRALQANAGEMGPDAGALRARAGSRTDSCRSRRRLSRCAGRRGLPAEGRRTADDRRVLRRDHGRLRSRRSPPRSPRRRRPTRRRSAHRSRGRAASPRGPTPAPAGSSSS